MTTTVDDKQTSKEFFNEWMGAKGPKGWVGRYISNTGRWYTDMLIREGHIKPEDKIIDVGCGSATTIVNLLKSVSLDEPIQAVEPSEEQLKLAKKNIGEAGFSDKIVLKQGFASPLDFKDNTFDLVYASFIIKHFADDSVADFFEEAHRVLKPGGRFLCWEFATVTSKIFKKLASNPKKAMQNFRSFEQIGKFLVAAGFKDIEEFKVQNRGFWDPVVDAGARATK